MFDRVLITLMQMPAFFYANTPILDHPFVRKSMYFQIMINYDSQKLFTSGFVLGKMKRW